MDADSQRIALEGEPNQSLVAGESLDVLRSFVDDLAAFGETLGLLGPREYPRIWTRHILNCAVVAPMLNSCAVIADVGSGAGLPGLVIAAMLPETECHLVEPMQRRVSWLSQEAERLGLRNVVVHALPAQEVDLLGRCDAVTSRAVAPLRGLIPLTAPLARSGGWLCLIKGQSVASEWQKARSVGKKYRLSDVSIERVGEGLIPEPTMVFTATVGR